MIELQIDNIVPVGEKTCVKCGKGFPKIVGIGSKQILRNYMKSHCHCPFEVNVDALEFFKNAKKTQGVK